MVNHEVMCLSVTTQFYFLFLHHMTASHVTHFIYTSVLLSVAAACLAALSRSLYLI